MPISPTPQPTALASRIGLQNSFRDLAGAGGTTPSPAVRPLSAKVVYVGQRQVGVRFTLDAE